MKLVGLVTMLAGMAFLSGPAMATPSDIVDVRTFGARCIGSSFNDAPGINAALSSVSAARGALVMLPPGGNCYIGATIHVPDHVTLAAYANSGNGDLHPLSQNLNMVSLDGSSAEVKDLWVNANFSSTNTAGTAIATGMYQFQKVHDVLITGAFLGMDINGNTTWVDRVTVNDVAAGGGGWSIGRLGTHANTADVRITNSTVGGNSQGAAYDQVIYDAGGLQEINVDLIFANFGTYIIPGINQEVDWTFFSNTVLGDTNSVGALVIDTTHPSAVVKGLQCDGCWVASQKNPTFGANILVNNGGGGTVDGLHFVGLRNYASAAAGVYLGAGTDISFEDSHFCGNVTQNIIVGGNISNVSVNGGQLGGGCDAATPGAAVGVWLAGNNSNIQISNVNFNGVATPVDGTPSTGSVAVGNYGMAPGTPTIASASSITLNGIYPTYTISGSTGISTIGGAWQNRQATLITTGAISFATGGNVCKAYTSVANVPILATYSGSCWYLK